MKRSSLAVAALTLVACTDPSTIASPNARAIGNRAANIATAYTITDLGTLGGSFGEASGVNESGQIVGYSRMDGSAAYRAFFWENGVMTALPSLGGSEDYPYALNNNGMAVGFSNVPGDMSSHAVVWRNGAITDIHPAGARNSYALAVNDVGQVALYAQFEAGIAYRSYVWENGVLTDLGSLHGGNTYVQGMNERGQIIGYSYKNNNGTPVAFVWYQGTMIELDSFDGGATVAQDINDAGQVTGYMWLTSQYRAVRWDPGTSLTVLYNGTFFNSHSAGRFINNAGDVGGSVGNFGAIWAGPTLSLSMLPMLGGAWNYVSSMNDAGLVAGVAANASGQSRALLWQSGTTLELPSLPGGSQTYVAQGRVAMNEQGHVVGASTVGDGSYHAVLWRPAAPPEPLTCSATPNEIWPANNQMTAVHVTIAGGGGIAGVTLRWVTNNETGAADADGWDIGSGDLEGRVRASRNGNGAGRTYSLVYNVTTTFGDRSDCTVTVRVPHDQGKNE